MEDVFVSYAYNRHLRVWVVSLCGVTVFVKSKDFKPLKDNLIKLNKSYKKMIGELNKNGIVW